MKKLDQEVKEFVEDVGYNTCKKAGLGATVAAFYMGMTPSPYDGGSFDEIANELELSGKEVIYWEDLWYKKDSWFNQMG